MKKNREAFTMLELVIVITVLGILAALVIPRMQRDLRQEAADNLVSAIRYTQHLAMMDDKTDPGNPKWQRRYWHIRFSTYDSDKRFYTISSSTDGNTNVDKRETAIDPANGKFMYHRGGGSASALTPQNDESPNIFLTKQYGIDTVHFSRSCRLNGSRLSRYLAFDYLGRPHAKIYNANLSGTSGSWNAPITQDCTITFTFKDGSDPLVLTIQKETGFVQVAGQNGS